ncbi:MAG: potassium transporter [Clostridiales bacterium GWF2_38_85]|nr:MAG: potassium transporter [Clostridiales bacterium GWF2_38_85]HBL85141.1 potassium transporter [Clostridiales bacterium]
MLISFAVILILGFTLSGIFQKLRLPGLLGMLLTGIILGPYALNLIDSSILSISADLREIALIVILVRAGLSLDIKDLKKVGRPAILLCFIPATLEIVGVVLLAPPFLGVSVIEAAIMGAMLAAVSPAVIVPKMLTLMEKGYGKKKSIPQMIMAGASADDIYAIVLFTSFISIDRGGSFDALSMLKIPVSILTGLFVGIGFGFFLVQVFKRIHMRDTIKILLILGISFLFVGFEEYVSAVVPFSGLLAVMALGGTVLKMREVVAKRTQGKFSKIWVAAELILFVLVGAAVDINAAYKAGVAAVLLIFGALLFRAVGVVISLIKTGLSFKEVLFCNIGYLPKATVQAAVGAIPLAMGVAAGNTILSVAVVSIIVTAPLGAILIDTTYKKCLKDDV